MLYERYSPGYFTHYVESPRPRTEYYLASRPNRRAVWYIGPEQPQTSPQQLNLNVVPYVNVRELEATFLFMSQHLEKFGRLKLNPTYVAQAIARLSPQAIISEQYVELKILGQDVFRTDGKNTRTTNSIPSLGIRNVTGEEASTQAVSFSYPGPRDLAARGLIVECKGGLHLSDGYDAIQAARQQILQRFREKRQDVPIKAFQDLDNLIGPFFSFGFP
jgi:hypothetical protein